MHSLTSGTTPSYPRAMAGSAHAMCSEWISKRLQHRKTRSFIHMHAHILKCPCTDSCQDISATDAPRLVHKQVRVGTPGPREVLIQFLAAPVNMQDELVVCKLYPVKPVYAAGTHTVERNSSTRTFPILGYDGAATVVECGKNVSALRPGDLVVPRRKPNSGPESASSSTRRRGALPSRSSSSSG